MPSLPLSSGGVERNGEQSGPFRLGVGSPEREGKEASFSLLEFSFNLTTPAIIFFSSPLGPILLSHPSSFSPSWVLGRRSAGAEPALVLSVTLGEPGPSLFRGLGLVEEGCEGQ